MYGRISRQELDADINALLNEPYVHPETHPASMIVEDNERKFLTALQLSKLDGIEEGATKYQHPVTHPASIIDESDSRRFLTATQVAKLDEIEERATNYQHPSTHEASMIVEDSARRFVTDNEKARWNSTIEVGDGAGKVNTTSTAPTATNRLNYEGYFYATRVYNAVYNDYAEYFKKGEENIEPGDILEVDESTGLYIKSKSEMSSLVVGVVSDDYAHCIGGLGDGNDDRDYASIGLAGRVRIKVTGDVKAGDLIVASSTRGVGRAIKKDEYFPGTVVGKALESHSGQNVINRVYCLILNM